MTPRKSKHTKKRYETGGLRYFIASIGIFIALLTGAFFIDELRYRQYYIALEKCGVAPIRVHTSDNTYVRPSERTYVPTRSYERTHYLDGLFLIGKPFYCSIEEAEVDGYTPRYKKPEPPTFH